MAAVDTGTLIGSTVGFVLAMVFITHMLVRYEDLLNDKKLARGFAFGFIAAVVAYFVEQTGIFSFNVQDMERDSSLAFISIFGIAILHTALKGMALNHRSLWDGKDVNVPFYGAFYGFIFGAVYVTVIISKTIAGGEVDGYIEPILLFLLALGMVLFQGSTSVIMGWGIPKGRLYGFFARIALLHIFLNIFIFLSAVGLIPYSLMVIMTLVYGSMLYGYSYQVVLPESLSKEQQKELYPTIRPISKRLSRQSGLSRSMEPEKNEKNFRNRDLDEKGNDEGHTDHDTEKKDDGEIVSIENDEETGNMKPDTKNEEDDGIQVTNKHDHDAGKEDTGNNEEDDERKSSNDNNQAAGKMESGKNTGYFKNLGKDASDEGKEEA